MLLSIFVITQIALDIALVTYLVKNGRRHRAALALLRAGTSAEEVARRERLLPGELRLMSNPVAAEAELAGARGR